MISKIKNASKRVLFIIALATLIVLSVGIYAYIISTHKKPVSLIPNASAENAEDDKPAEWKTGSWGKNDAEFFYANDGYTGKKGLKVEIKNYSDGDAKWFLDAIKVEGGKIYSFEDYYKANVSTEIILAYSKENSEQQYVSLGVVQPAEAWSKYSTEFLVPSDISQVSIYHVLKSQGRLIIDDVYLGQVQK